MKQPAPLVPAPPTGSFLSLGTMTKVSDSTPSDAALPKPRRDTAEGCRDRATASRQHAGTMVCADDAKLLEDSAASWSARADLLQRLETAAKVLLTVTVAPVLTAITHIVVPPAD